jgi:hypothetical protein
MTPSLRAAKRGPMINSDAAPQHEVQELLHGFFVRSGSHAGLSKQGLSIRFSLRQREPLRHKTSSCKIEMRERWQARVLDGRRACNGAPDRFAIGA